MKTIAKAKITALLDEIAKEFNLLVPTSGDGNSKFAPYTKDAQVNFEGRTLLPPKDLFFPQTEKMYKFSTDGMSGSLESSLEAPKHQVLFGIRPCDAKSIHCLDHVFLTKGFVDEFYQVKRDRTLLVSLGCNKPAEPTCFCQSMDVNPQEAIEADVQLYDLGSEYGAVSKSTKGEAFLAKYAGLFAEADAQIPAVEKFPLNVDVEGITPKLQKMFEHPIWDELSKKCIGCGACTYLCPTCHCFDISARVAGTEGFKFRCWDSCMFSEYSRMAGGHNPRPSKKERVRNRFLHKLQYFPERYGDLLCTGCGRCMSKCPVNMDITNIIKQVKEVDLG
ncbi:MAG TPA: 4Fe-4S dicluster domain-containing protein [Candidatus Deferrimicrobium sp.]|nr:4Fe-4S dicluster domain-containing protein [Candidatus Deferrimicrobium sp.]